MEQNPYQAPEATLPKAGIPGRTRLTRFLLAFGCSFAIIFACMMSLQNGRIDFERFLLTAAAVAIFALPASGLATALVRRSEAGLILLAQCLTLLGLHAIFTLTN